MERKFASPPRGLKAYVLAEGYRCASVRLGIGWKVSGPPPYVFLGGGRGFGFRLLSRYFVRVAPCSYAKGSGRLGLKIRRCCEMVLIGNGYVLIMYV